MRHHRGEKLDEDVGGFREGGAEVGRNFAALHLVERGGQRVGQLVNVRDAAVEAQPLDILAHLDQRGMGSLANRACGSARPTRRTFATRDHILQLAHKPPEPLHQARGALHPLLRPDDIALRWRIRQHEPARRVGAEGSRRATLLKTGEPIEIGPVEKMSKSKKNTVDPDDIMDSYGADVARWFMLSDSPPDRDVIWSEEGVQGASRFVQRLWRLIGEIARVKGPATRPSQFSDSALTVRKAAHRALANVSEDIAKLRFNRCVAHIYELTNSLTEALDEIDSAAIPAELRAAFREAADILVQLFAPMMPHLAEECWADLGHGSPVAEAAWPAADRSLVIEDMLSLPVQVNGKKRADLVIERNADQAAIEAATLALDSVQRALAGKAPKKIIVVPQRIVNVVA
ncbi:MAG: class I tRNA ligase family protein [Xanthobacteraceae bacterium]|nr:class I tRNA ligase family protein [Xanthobacteraceae bacterium]